MPIFEYAEANQRSPEEVARLQADLLAALREAVGERWVTMDPLILDTYAWQYLAEMASGSNYMERPLAVVLPATTAEVAAIVKACNRLGCQYKAFSTGFGPWNGATRPHQMVQIDLRRMDRIVEIDARNMYAVVEPYVSGNQLQTEAMKVGLKYSESFSAIRFNRIVGISFSDRNREDANRILCILPRLAGLCGDGRNAG